MTDRRPEKTRQAIIDAFVTLLATNSYEKVSVKDIIDSANVGRSTFYAHFETKEELARQICISLFEHIFSSTIPPCSTHNFANLPQTAENRIAHILYHLRDKRKYYIGIISYDDASLFLRFFRDYMRDNIRIVLAGPYKEKLSRIPEDFIAGHLASSFIGMLSWWLKNKMQPSPETAAAYYITLINPGIAEFEHDR